jgi:hypothetical protein
MGMKRNNEYTYLFDAEGHLNEEGQALTVDALMLGKTPRLPGPVQDHISLCQECRREIASLYDLVSENKVLHPRVYHPLFDAESAGPGRKTSVTAFATGLFQRLRSPWGLAATILVLLALGGSWFLANSRSNEEEKFREEIVGIMDADTVEYSGTISTEETLQYADNHMDHRIASAEGNPRLEAMYQLHLRGNDFSLMSPEKSTTVRQMEKIAFAWESPGTLKKLDLMIIDGQGVRRAQIGLKQKQYQFTVNLPEGLYYWVIVGDNELMSVGKFKVIRD